MSEDLALRAAPALAPLPSTGDIDTMWRLAQMAAASKALIKGSAGTAEQQSAYLFSKMMIGREFGLTPAQALSGGLHIFDGNVQMAATTLATAIRARGYDYTITWTSPEGFKGPQSEDAAGCSITFTTPQGVERGPSEFTIQDAKNAGLFPNKDNWKKHPRNMCLARAMSNGAKWFIPEALAGIPVYSEGDDFGSDVERVPNLAEGNGDGSEPGWGTMPIPLVGEVEKVIRRAEKLGHGALANRASVQQIVKGMDQDDLAAWLGDAIDSLDALKASREQREPAVEGTAEEEPQAPPAEPTFPQATGESDVPSTWPGAPPSVTDPANAKVVEPAREYGEQAPAPATGLATPPAQPPAPPAPDGPEAAPQAPEARPKRRRATSSPQQHTITVPAQATEATQTTIPATTEVRTAQEASAGPQTQSQANAGEPQAPADDPEEELDLFGDGDDA